MPHRVHFLTPLAAALLVFSSQTFAAGAEVPFISISSLGTANANAAEAEDASVQYWNPAGMAQFKGTGLRIAQPFGLIFARGRVENDTSNNGGTSGVAPYGTPDGTQGTLRSTDFPGGARFFPKVLPIGAVFASLPVNDVATLGFGVFSPGGGNLNYKGDWFGRYFIKLAAIETVNFNPSIALRFDDKHSVGAGVSLVAGHAVLNQKIDIPGVGPYFTQPILRDARATQLGVLGTALGGIPAVGPILNQLTAGTAYNLLSASQQQLLNNTAYNVLIDPSSTASAEIQTYGIGTGFNFGYMFNIDEDQRFSLSFRSKTVVHFKGDLTWDFTNVRTSNNGALDSTLFGMPFNQYLAKYYRPDTKARTDLVLPSKVDIAYFGRMTPKIDIMANLQLNQSNAVKDLCVVFSPVAAPADAAAANSPVQQGSKCVNLNWRNTYTASLGMNYHLDNKVTLRTGVQYDQTPVPSAQYRYPALPDNNRFMVSVGFNYRHDKNLSIDGAYSYLRIQDAGANYHDTCRVIYYEGGAPNDNSCTSNGGDFRANYKGLHAHIVGMQLNKRF